MESLSLPSIDISHAALEELGYNLDVTVEYTCPSGELKKWEGTFSSEIEDYEGHIKTLLQHFDIKTTDARNFILQHEDNKKRKKYLLQKDLLNPSKNYGGRTFVLSDQTVDAKDSLVKLKKISNWLQEPESKGATNMKDVLWFLDFEGMLRGEVFVEEFVEGGGMPMLMTILESSRKDNMTKLAVSCLYTACEYEEPLEYLRETEGAMERLFKLIYKAIIKI
ncbi:hypothetical protein AAMO2058_001389300 [Amorphochlora amoebiformis]